MFNYLVSCATRSVFATLLLVSLSFSAGCVSASRTTQVDAGSSSSSRIPGALSLDEKFKKANSAYQDGMLVEAERWFLNIVADHPNLADAWFKLGNIYYRSGRYAAAVNAYEQVLVNDSAYEQAWYNLALTRVSQSVEVIDQALPYIAHDSPYFDRALALKERLINRVAEKSEQVETPISDTQAVEIEPASRVGSDQLDDNKSGFTDDTSGQ
ncbi:tetratricopeptide repeat protein [Arenicella xantha]|uniref:TPR repeat protein n=1 Tax=Arenicella xantha TaxID=644221 RepID=A0A395JLS0_9GAMM|nr:tetratricopeptide repeat protein [Arenicella xantha]RBP51375.1 TPR repeat protein [Arenicella xantha]